MEKVQNPTDPNSSAITSNPKKSNTAVNLILGTVMLLLIVVISIVGYLLLNTAGSDAPTKPSFIRSVFTRDPSSYSPTLSPSSTAIAFTPPPINIGHVSDWENYESSKYNFNLKYPKNISFEIDIISSNNIINLNFNKGLTNSFTFSATRNFTQTEENTFKGTQSIGLKSINGNAWKVFLTPEGYGLKTRKQSVLYSVLLHNQNTTTELQDKIINTLNFSSSNTTEGLVLNCPENHSLTTTDYFSVCTADKYTTTEELYSAFQSTTGHADYIFYTEDRSESTLVGNKFYGTWSNDCPLIQDESTIAGYRAIRYSQGSANNCSLITRYATVSDSTVSTKWYVYTFSPKGANLQNHLEVVNSLIIIKEP